MQLVVSCLRYVKKNYGFKQKKLFFQTFTFWGIGWLSACRLLVDLHGNLSNLACRSRTQTSMKRSPALCTLLLPIPLLLLSEWKLDYSLSEICQYYVLYFDAFCSSISTQWMTSSANVVLLQLTSVYLSDYSRKFRRKGLSVKFTFLLVSLESGAFI